MKTAGWKCLLGIGAAAWAGVGLAQEATEVTSASFVVGDVLVFWQAGRGATIAYRGIPVFTGSGSEFVVHRKWEDVYYRTETGGEKATLTQGPQESVLTIRDRTERFAVSKRITVRADGTLGVACEYEVLDPDEAELQLLFGVGTAWLNGSSYRLVVGGQERTGELKCPESGRIDPWGGATEQVFTTRFGTLTVKSERPLNLLCNPDSAAMWLGQALRRGERYTEVIEVRIEPGAAAETGVRLAGVEWPRQVRDGRARFALRLSRTADGPQQVAVHAERTGGGDKAPGPAVTANLGETPVAAECEAVIDQRGQHGFAVVAVDAADGKEVLRMGPLLVDSSPYLRVMPRLSLFTSEKEAGIVADLAEDLDLAGLTIAVSGPGVAEVRREAADRRVIVPVDISALPDGVSGVQCRVLRGEEQVAQATTEIRKAPPKPNEAKIDNLSRGLIVDGLPFVPFGYYTYYPLKEGVMDEEVVRGFNLFSPYHGGPHTAEELGPIREYMDRCAAIGMRVNYHLMWSNRAEMSEEEWGLLRAEIEAFRDHPALLSWYTADEPGTERAAHLQKVYELLKELDPYHPVTIVFYQGAEHARQFVKGMDIVMGDPYPIPSNPPVNVAHMADALNEAFDFRKPLWIVPQAFGGNEWWQREPTAQEQRVMTYLALIHGARAIQYFIRSPRVSFPKSPIMWAECGRLALETAELTPWLVSGEVAPRVTASAPSVHVCALRDRGIVTVLAANTEKRPQTVRLQLEGVDVTGEAEVLFEDRRVAVTGGAIEEPIDSYGSRVYAIPLGPLPQDDVAVGAGNMVYDPSWEIVPSVGTPSGCYAYIPFGATCFVDSRVARHGRHSLRMTAPDGEHMPSLSPFPVALKAGQAYRVSIWAKGKSEGVVLKLSLGDLGSQGYPLTTDWREYAFTVKPEGDVGRVSLSLGLGSAGVAWVDLMQVVPQA